MKIPSPIAVIDLGSNTSKLSVISVPSFNRLHHSVRYTRIGKGMVKGKQHLSDSAIEACIQAINELIQEAEKYGVVHYEIVATSAVRDAENRTEFIERVEAETGLKPRILTGDEEATLIGKGAATDPILSDCVGALTVFDLGGGSLECIHFENSVARQVVSLPLGAVRMTEQYIANPQAVIPLTELDTIFEYAQNQLRGCEFDFSSTPSLHVGTGGAFVVTRAVSALKNGKDLRRSSPVIAVKEIGNLFSTISKMTLQERCAIPGMSKERADILPAALAVLLALAEIARIEVFMHSYHNLPYGLALEWKEACESEK